MDWERLFNSSAEKMKHSLEEARAAVAHNGLKGHVNERIFEEWLKKYLPRSIGVCTGEVIDSLGGRSKQIDVIAFDEATTPRFFEEANVNVLPVEPVYAVFEIKAYLNKGEIEAAFKNMQAIKKLKKTAYFPTTPTTKKTQYGKQYDHWPVQFFLFAFDSDGLDTVLSHIKHLNEPQPIDQRIDMVCVLDKGLIVYSGAEGLHPIPMPKADLIQKDSNKALLTFYALISGILAQGISEPVCIHNYIKHIKH